MKILVTGGYGFIGSSFIRNILKDENFRVVNIDNLTYAANIKSLEGFENKKNYKFYKADIGNKSKLEEIFNIEKPNFVVHFAAESHVDNSIESPMLFMKTNIIGTYNLLEASRSLNKNHFKLFLHVSTDEVFGDLQIDDDPFTEENKYFPNSPYSASKASSDLIARAWNKTYKLPVIITNCSNNFGPFQNSEKLIPTIIRNAINSNKIPIYGDGQNVRDWLYVEDHVNGLKRILTNGSIGETYNIGGGYEINNLDLTKLICRILDQRFPKEDNYESNIAFVEDRKGHDFRYSIDSTKILTSLDWKPEHKFADSIEDTIDWYLKNTIVKR